MVVLYVVFAARAAQSLDAGCQSYPVVSADLGVAFDAEGEHVSARGLVAKSLTDDVAADVEHKIGALAAASADTAGAVEHSTSEHSAGAVMVALHTSDVGRDRMTRRQRQASWIVECDRILGDRDDCPFVRQP